MKYPLALLFAVLMSAPALAEKKCDYGSPDILEFKKWDFKNIDNHWVEITVSFHNKTNQNFSEANLRLVVDGHTPVPIRDHDAIKAGSDATATDQIGTDLPTMKDLAAQTPLLCVEYTYDEKGERKRY